MLVEISVPTEHYKPVLNSLTQRGGNIFFTETLSDVFVMKAKVTLSSMFGFMGEMRGHTQGQGELSMEYLTHTPVPKGEQDKIV